MSAAEDFNTRSDVYHRCMSTFNCHIKVDFRNSGQDWAVDVDAKKDYLDTNIKDGYMTFTNNENFQCFEPVVFGAFEYPFC
jgi:hypothetical protein